MSSSLIVGTYDLLDVTTPSPVLAGDTYDRGAPIPDLATFTSGLVDGSPVFGDRANNRQITLPVIVIGSDRLDAISRLNDVLLFTSSDSWTMTYTPDGGLPVVYDCYQATHTVSSTDVVESQFVVLATLTFQALPFLRSPDAQVVALSGSSVVVDSFDAAGTRTFTFTPHGTGFSGSSALSTAQIYAGTHSFALTWSCGSGLPSPAPAVVLDLVTTAISANLVGMTTLKIRRYFGPSNPATATMTVTGVSNTVYNLGATAVPGVTGWQTITFDCTAVNETIKAYHLTYTHYDYAATIYFDDMEAYPAAVPAASSAQGGLYTLSGVLGTARAPVAVEVDGAGGASLSQMLLHRQPPGSLAQSLLPLGSAVQPITVAASVNSWFDGSFRVLLALGNVVNTPGAARTVTVAFNLYNGTTSVTGPTMVCTYSPSAGFAKTYLPVVDNTRLSDVVYLPPLGAPDDAAWYLRVTLSSTNTLDKFDDLLLLDTRGDTILVQGGTISTGTLAAVFVDEPAVGQDDGLISGSTATSGSGGRATALSIGAYTNVAGFGPLRVYPGDNQFLVHAPTGAPASTVTYAPRWQQDRTV